MVELLVVMGLTGIVLLIALGILSTVQSSFVDYQSQQVRVSQFRAFDARIRRDCAYAEDVELRNDTLCFKMSEPSVLVRYFNQEGYCLRSGFGAVDTFPVPVGEFWLRADTKGAWVGLSSLDAVWRWR